MATTTAPPLLASGRAGMSKGLLTVVVSTIVLFGLGAVLAPSSISTGAVLGMLPFAAVLAVVGLGQMLVVQQGGIDLSVPGGVSLAVVIVSHMPNENDALLLPAVLVAYAWAIGAGLLNGFLVGRLGLNPIIATLGTNALLFGAVLGISGGIPRTTTDLLSTIAGDSTLGVPNAVLFAVAIMLIVTVVTKKTVAGRRFEAVGTSPLAARATGLRYKTHQGSAYVWAQLLFATAGILLAGITNQPTAFQGNTYLLTSVAVVVLGGTSLLGGDRGRRAVPEPAGPVRPGARRSFRRSHPRAGCGARRRGGDLHRQLDRAAGATLSTPHRETGDITMTPWPTPGRVHQETCDAVVAPIIWRRT